MQLTIATNFKDVQKALDGLQAGLREKALVSGINKTLALAKTAMGREITGVFNVKSAYVRERLRIRRASFKQGRFEIEGSLVGGRVNKRSANIIAFVERVVTLASRRKRIKTGTNKMLFVRVKRGAPAKPLAGAFIANQGRTVFERLGKQRLPIKPVQVIDVAQMFNTRRINARVVQLMRDRFPEIFTREARYYTDRFNRAAR
jgi:Prophage minor tail protein Z (GPZ)